MTHVLLSGERKVVERIGAFLDDWGMTHSRLGPDRDPARVPLLECDVVILGCGPDSAREAEPAGDAGKGCAERFIRPAETFSEVAPLLVVGNPSDHQNGLAAVRAVVPSRPSPPPRALPRSTPSTKSAAPTPRITACLPQRGVLFPAVYIAITPFSW